MNGINEHFIPCVKSWNIKNQISGDMVRVCVCMCGGERAIMPAVYTYDLCKSGMKKVYRNIGMNALWN